MKKITLYHGTPNQIVIPIFGGGDDRHDYGRGFYLTEDIELAKEWAVCRPNEQNGRKFPVEFLKKAYYGLHDLDLELAVQKVGKDL